MDPPYMITDYLYRFICGVLANHISELYDRIVVRRVMNTKYMKYMIGSGFRKPKGIMGVRIQGSREHKT